MFLKKNLNFRDFNFQTAGANFFFGLRPAMGVVGCEMMNINGSRRMICGSNVLGSSSSVMLSVFITGHVVRFHLRPCYAFITSTMLS